MEKEPCGILTNWRRSFRPFALPLPSCPFLTPKSVPISPPSPSPLSITLPWATFAPNTKRSSPFGFPPHRSIFPRWNPHDLLGAFPSNKTNSHALPTPTLRWWYAFRVHYSPLLSPETLFDPRKEFLFHQKISCSHFQSNRISIVFVNQFWWVLVSTLSGQTTTETQSHTNKAHCVSSSNYILFTSKIHF